MQHITSSIYARFIVYTDGMICCNHHLL